MSVLAPPDDQRLQVLAATRLLDSDPEEGFDRLTRLATKLLGMPVGLVSLVDAHRQFFKSALGLGEPWASRRETPLTHSFCQYVVRERAPLVVRDAREHPLLKDNRAVEELGAIAYAGIPLIVEDQAVGAFCVIDHEPRDFPADKLGILEDLAASVVAMIELRIAARAADAARGLTAALVESIGDACMAVDRSGQFILINQAARRIFHDDARVGTRVPNDWAALHRSRRADGSILPSEAGPLNRAVRGEASDNLVFTLTKPGASEPVWVEASGRPVYGESAELVAAVATYRDVTQRRLEARELEHARDSLALQQSLLETTLAHIDEAVALIDAQNRVLLANQAFASLLGLDKNAVIGLTRQGFVERLSPLLAEPEKLAQTLDMQAPGVRHEFVVTAPRRRVLARSWTPVTLSDGRGMLVTWRDVTAEHDLLRERERLLLVDALTGIPNRRAAENALRAEHERLKRAGSAFCVALFDIDHFKRVNDVFGHGTGDEVLKLVAASLTSQVRLNDTVARWGGEEFIAVLNAPLDGARVFCERSRQRVEALECPPVGQITLSAGVAEVLADETLAEALHRADQHLYAAKGAGRNRVHPCL